MCECVCVYCSCIKIIFQNEISVNYYKIYIFYYYFIYFSSIHLFQDVYVHLRDKFHCKF